MFRFCNISSLQRKRFPHLCYASSLFIFLYNATQTHETRARDLWYPISIPLSLSCRVSILSPSASLSLPLSLYLLYSLQSIQSRMHSFQKTGMASVWFSSRSLSSLSIS